MTNRPRNKYDGHSTVRKKKKETLSFMTGALFLMIAAINLAQAGNRINLTIFLGEAGIKPVLSGIGYYEAIEQVGINGASFAGTTEVVIYGAGMSTTPQSISAIFSNSMMG
jgi:hypothetical protein